MADINDDGLLDIYVCYSGKLPEEQRKNQLFINQGNNKFIDKAAEYGLVDKAVLSRLPSSTSTTMATSICSC